MKRREIRGDRQTQQQRSRKRDRRRQSRAWPEGVLSVVSEVSTGKEGKSKKEKVERWNCSPHFSGLSSSSAVRKVSHIVPKPTSNCSVTAALRLAACLCASTCFFKSGDSFWRARKKLRQVIRSQSLAC